MEKKIGALFDLDGVLLDSEGIYTQFWDAVEEVYPTHIPNFSSVIKGSNLFEILHDNYPDDETRQKVSDMLHAFQRDMAFVFFDGAMEFVERLNAAGIPACVVTSSDQRKMEALASCWEPRLSVSTSITVWSLRTRSRGWRLAACRALMSWGSPPPYRARSSKTKPTK